MILPIDTQLWYFLTTVIAGVIVGILFDMYRVVVACNHPNRILMAISDVLYWVLCAIVVFLFFLYTNNGNLRYYSFIGMLTGLLFYFKLASKRLIIAMRAFGQAVVRLARLLWSGISYPARHILYFLKFVVMKVRMTR